MKLSLFEVNIVYQSFPIALFTEVSFLPRESFVECAGELVFVVFEASCRQVSGWFYLTQFRDSNGEIILPYKERTGKKSSMFEGFLKSSKQMDVESERVIKSFERLYGFTECVTKTFEEIDDCFYQTGDQVVRTDECFYQTGIQVVRTVGRFH